MVGNKLIFKNAEEVRNAIVASQKKEIAKLYEDWADEIGERAKYYSHKSTASAPVSERYYRELQKQLRATSQEVSNEIYKKIKSNIYTVADAVVSDNVKWLADFGFSVDGLNAAFSYVPDEIVRNLVTGQIYDSGWSLSSRIWGDNEQTLKDIYQVMAKGLAENKPIYEIAKDLESYVRPSAKLPWNLRMADGKKIYKKQVDYNAQRLARTLVQHGYQQSFIATTQKNPFITEYIWHSNGSRACPLCMDRDGRVFQKDDLPMDHPNGMCTMEPVVADNMVDQLADWFNSPNGTYPEIDEFAKDFGYKAKKPIDMNSLTNHLTAYVGGGYLSVKDAVTPEEFEYIQSKMKSSSNSFYRLEEMRFTVRNKDLQKGSTFTFTDNLRSFTSERDDIEKFLKQAEDWGGYESPVVFQTIGDVKTFDMSPYTKEYTKLMGDQHEHLIGGEMKVVDFEYKFINNVKVLFVKIKKIK